MRVLAPATKAMYVAAKGSFDKGEFETAKGQFSELLAVLAEPELAKTAGDGRSEDARRRVCQAGRPAARATGGARRRHPAARRLPRPRQRAAAGGGRPGCRRRSAGADDRAAVAPATTPPARPSAPPPAGTAATRPQPASDAGDVHRRRAGVVAPVPIDQRLPPWVPPANLRGESFSGLIEVVIDETGKVTSAVISKIGEPGLRSAAARRGAAVAVPAGAAERPAGQIPAGRVGGAGADAG